jgi:DNA-binding IclR family transcriptional regulator
MAWAGQDLLRQVVAAGLRPYTKNTLADLGELEAALEGVRAEGYALDLEEYEEGLRCAAAPVRDHAGQVVAAIGIAGPSHRLTDEQLPRVIPSVTGAANTISRNLGYVSLERAAVGE